MQYSQLSISRSRFSLWKEAFLGILFPASCLSCKNVLSLYEERVCNNCLSSIDSLKRALSARFLDINRGSLGEAWALYKYEGAVETMVQALKYRHQAWVVELFQSELIQWVERLHAEHHYDFLLPIPTTFSRRLNRFYNQTELIAAPVSRELGIPVKTNVLRRLPTKKSQIYLNRNERFRNLENAFRMRPLSSIKGKKILLVDDVITTGATAYNAAVCLKKSGAKRVDVVAIAQPI